MFNPLTSGWDDRNSAHSIFGALPPVSSPPPPTSNNLLFQFTNMRPNVLNSVVIDSYNRPVFKISTDEMYTVVKTEQGVLASVEWRMPPMVEIREQFPKTPASSWLRMVVDEQTRRPLRHLSIRGIRVFWVPDGERLNLCAAAAPSHIYASISRTRSSVYLEMTNEAFNAGMLISVVVSTAMLLSGRRLE